MTSFFDAGGERSSPSAGTRWSALAPSPETERSIVRDALVALRSLAHRGSWARERAGQEVEGIRGFEARLLGGMLAICLVFAPMLLFAVHSLRAAAREEHAMSTRFTNTIVLAQNLSELQSRQDALIPVFVISGEPAVGRALDAAHRQFDVTMAALRATERTGTDRRELQVIADRRRQLMEVQREGIRQRQDGGSVALVSDFMRRYAGPRAQKLRQAIDLFLGRATASYELDVRENQRYIGWAMRSLVGAAVLAAAFCLVILVLIARTLRHKARHDRLLDVLAHRERRLSTARKETVETVAHDLKNPLTAIMLMAERLESPGLASRPDRQAYFARGIASAAESMNLLIRNLLDNTKIAEGVMTLSLDVCDAGALAKRLAARFVLAAEARSLTIVDAVPADLPCVTADVGRLEQVVSNLIGNAIKFTPAGGRIELGGGSDETHLLLTVADNGVGMTDAQIARAFDRYWQATDGAAQGTGLGLPISRAIVEAHGGTIAVESRAGAGSRFTIRFPLPAAEPAAA